MGRSVISWGQMKQLYANTPENAARIGWANVPEYCIGDLTLPTVVHDPVAGTFTYARCCD